MNAGKKRKKAAARVKEKRRVKRKRWNEWEHESRKKYYQAQNEHDEMKLMYTNESQRMGLKKWHTHSERESVSEREREAKEQKLYRNVGSKFERVSAIRCAWCGQSAKSVSHSFEVNGGWAVEKVHGRVYSCWTVVFIISITFSTLNSWTGVEKKCLPAKRKTRKMLRTENRKKCCHLSERRRRRCGKKESGNVQ